MPEISAVQLRSLERAINQLNSAQAEIGDRIGQVAASQNATRGELAILMREFHAYVEQDRRAKNVAGAGVNVIDVRMRLDNEFGHYAELRRMATGIVEAVDSRTVTDATIQSVTESVTATTPGYWLAPALVGLAAWLRDDRAVADNAVRSAMERDSRKTALFYALLLRRYGRTAAAAHWIRRYVERQDPANLSREFVVVLDAVSTGALGPESRPMVMEQVAQWYARLSADETVVAGQIARWHKLIAGLRTPLDLPLSVLPEVCPVWDTMKDLYEGATVHARADALFHRLLDAPVRPDTELNNRVDRLLTSLVKEFDAEEGPLRRELDAQQAIIDHGGDLEAAARAQEAASSARDESQDYLTLLTNAAFFPEKSGTSEGTRQLAVALARDWIVAADRGLALANREAWPKTVRVTIHGWSGNLIGGASLDLMEASLATSVLKTTEAAVAKVRPGGGFGAAIAAGCVAALITILTLAHGAVGPGVFFLLATLGCAGAALVQYDKVPRRREELRKEGRRRSSDGVNTLRQAAAEYTDLVTAWRQQDAKAEPFTDYLGALNFGAYLTRPTDQIREVL
jgi:hypothetical protein